MAKIPNYRRIFKTDYAEDYQELVDKLAVSINYGFDVVYDALNKKLTFDDNIACTIAEFTVSVDIDGKPLKSNTQFKLGENQTSIQGLIVIDCYEEKTDNPPPSAPFVTFVKNEKNVLIKNIKGLTANTSYVIKVLAIS